MNKRLRKHLIELIPLLILVLATMLYIVFAVINYTRLERELMVIDADWRLDGKVYDMLPERKEGSSTDTLLERELDERFDAPLSLGFYSTYQTVRVKLDDEVIFEFLKPYGEHAMKAAPNHWNCVELPEGISGRTLSIHLSTPYAQYAHVLPKVLAGSNAQIEQYITLRTNSRMIAALAVLFVGLIFSFVAVAMRYYVVGNTGLYTLSLFIIVLAIFFLAQQTTILLEMNDRISYILLENIAFMLCPILYTRYQMRVYKGTMRSVAHIMHVISTLTGALLLCVQIWGTQDLPQMITLTRNICAVIIVIELIFELKNRHRLLVCLFAMLMVYAALLYYFTDTITWLAYAGILAYMFILIYRVITTAVRGQMRQVRLEAALEVSKSEIATIQITSHFFYHTLDSIRALIRLDADKAYKMTGDFAKYIRHRVDGVEKMQETIPFSRELRSIRAYTDIKQAQLGARFEMIYDVEGEDFEILPLTVQPLVENAIIHAVQRRREGGMVRLKCRESKQGYRIEVIDNGAGAGAPPDMDSMQRESTAIKNVNTRLEFFGIAPLQFSANELGGMTVSLFTPKIIVRKGKAQ